MTDYNDSGDVIVEPAAIRKNYLHGWFTIDILSCFPGGYISYYYESQGVEDDGGNTTRLLRILRTYPGNLHVILIDQLTRPCLL